MIAIAPAYTNLGGEKFGINLVLVRLQEVLESNDVRFDHLEDGKAAIQTELPRLWHEIVFRLVQQDEQPGFAGLLVIRRIALRTAVNGGHADAVGVTEVNLGGGGEFAILNFHQRHATSPGQVMPRLRQ